MFAWWNQRHNDDCTYQLIRQLVANLDALLPNALTNIILQYFDSSRMEFHVTRHIVLEFPMLSFRHMSVYNVRIFDRAVVFRVIADVEYCCMLFELRLDDSYQKTIEGVSNLYPTDVVTANDRAHFIARFIHRMMQQFGLFHGSVSSTGVFDVVACDGMSSKDSTFCPGFNLFRISDQRVVGAIVHKLFPSRISMI